MGVEEEEEEEEEEELISGWKSWFLERFKGIVSRPALRLGRLGVVLVMVEGFGEI